MPLKTRQYNKNVHTARGDHVCHSGARNGHNRKMARIRPLSADEVEPNLRQMLEQAAKTFGEPLVSSGIQAHCPPILEASRNLGAAPARSHKLPPLIRSLVCLRAAQMVGCPF